MILRLTTQKAFRTERKAWIAKQKREEKWYFWDIKYIFMRNGTQPHTYPGKRPCWAPSWGAGECKWWYSKPHRKQSTQVWIAWWRRGSPEADSSHLHCSLRHKRVAITRITNTFITKERLAGLSELDRHLKLYDTTEAFRNLSPLCSGSNSFAQSEAKQSAILGH